MCQKKKHDHRTKTQEIIYFLSICQTCTHVHWHLQQTWKFTLNSPITASVLSERESHTCREREIFMMYNAVWQCWLWNIANKTEFKRLRLTVIKMGSSNKSDGVSKKFRKNVCQEKNSPRKILKLKANRCIHNFLKIMFFVFFFLPLQRLGCCPFGCVSSSSAQQPIPWQRAWCLCLATVGPRWPAPEPGKKTWLVTSSESGCEF